MATTKRGVGAKRRRYTDAEREAVLAEVRVSGVNAAAKKHGVPQTCCQSVGEGRFGRSRG